MTGFVRNLFGADNANDAQVLATSQSVAGQQAALDYLKQREAVPMEIRDQALKGLADYYHVPGEAKTQDQLIQEALASPLYRSLMDTRGAATDQIERYAAANGQLRSPGTSMLVRRENTAIANDALLKSFGAAQTRDDQLRTEQLRGLGGLAQLPSNDQAIAQGMSNIGQTQAQGTIAQANTQTGATNNVFGTLLGLGSIGAQAGWFSDMRLKSNIRYVGHIKGHAFYKWEWNRAANEIGLHGTGGGVIAHDVFETHPHAVELSKEGYLKVRYDLLDLDDERAAA
jgi:hypothetical protein